MQKTIQNLIDKFGADKLHQMIDEQVNYQKDQNKLTKIFATHRSATEWFEQFCKDNNFTFVNVYDQTIEQQEPDYNEHGKSCLTLNGWRCDGPYVYLWLNKDSQPHFEMGSSIYDIWSYMGYDDAIDKIKKIVKLRQDKDQKSIAQALTTR